MSEGDGPYRTVVVTLRVPADLDVRQGLRDLRGYTAAGAELELAITGAVIDEPTRRECLTAEGAYDAVRAYGSQVRAARALGVPRSTLRDALRRDR